MTTTSDRFFFFRYRSVRTGLPPIWSATWKMYRRLRILRDGSNAATTIAVNASPRIDACTMGSRQIVLNAITADVTANNEQPLSITVDAWLDSKLGTFACIAMKAAE